MGIINSNLLKEKIDATVNADISAGIVGAASVSVCQNGKEIYKGHFSNSDAGFIADDSTLFRLASMTKPVTAVAVFILIDRGLIGLDDKVSVYLPGFEKMKIGKYENDSIIITGDSATPMTIRHLLSHSCGIGCGTVGYAHLDMLPVNERISLEKVVNYYTECPLDFEPFTSQAYSAVHAFDILARVVEIVSGKSFDLFLKEELFEPLGMKNTTFSPSEEQWSKMIPMHNYCEGKAVFAEFPKNSVYEGYPTTYFCGGAGLASTLEDYQKFAQMLLNKGLVGDCRIVSERMIDEMARPQIPLNIMNYDWNWGLSVRVITKKIYDRLPVGSFGWSGAYGTHFWIDPVNKISAVYMKNSRFDGGAGASTAAAFERDVKAAL